MMMAINDDSDDNDDIDDDDNSDDYLPGSALRV